MLMGLAGALYEDFSIVSMGRGFAAGSLLGVIVALYAFFAWICFSPLVALLFVMRLVRWWSFALVGLVAALGVLAYFPPNFFVPEARWLFCITGPASGIAFWLMIFEE